MNKKRNVIVSILAFAVLLGVLKVLEMVMPGSMLLTVLKKGSIYALVAVSMNLLNGFTGLFSLGQAGFMMIGAYVYAIFTIPGDQREIVYMYYDGGVVQFAVPALVGILLAGIFAAAFAFLIGIPVLRLKSDYLAIATLGFAEIMRAFFQWDTLGPVTNGSNMLRSFPTFKSVLFPFAVSGVCIAVIVLMINSTYGRAFKAIRDDEIAAEAMGINLAKHKRIAFTVSSFFAGVSGALLAMYQNNVQAKSYNSAMTYEILLIVVIGGIGSITGSIISSFLFIACSEWILRFLDETHTVAGKTLPLMRSGFRKVVFSIIIMIIVLFFRQGIMGSKEFSMNRFLDRLTGKTKNKAKGGDSNA
ncbi:MAG: branched-chain amino acid ABC transporter permease [Eubacteriales bacterium]|nr:branched-chain amino acid ABC transporter permease [Eubacteriales bacterium]